ncbi:MAG: hypothetical protein PHQ43_14350 [Dehalococcoidales bacterium]|nr:hypothetical protein [Dehalococcoidales bacterium]
MPGEFYVEGKQEKVSLQGVESSLADLNAKADAIKTKTDNLAGETPGQGSTTADWQVAESSVISIGNAGTRVKIHDLTLSIHNLVGTQVTIRFYKKVNGTERKVYDQTFDATADPPGLPVINGTWAIHDILRATLQSNNAADNGQAVDYDCLLEVMS